MKQNFGTFLIIKSILKCIDQQNYLLWLHFHPKNPITRHWSKIIPWWVQSQHAMNTQRILEQRKLKDNLNYLKHSSKIGMMNRISLSPFKTWWLREWVDNWFHEIILAPCFIFYRLLQNVSVCGKSLSISHIFANHVWSCLSLLIFILIRKMVEYAHMWLSQNILKQWIIYRWHISFWRWMAMEAMCNLSSKFFLIPKWRCAFELVCKLFWVISWVEVWPFGISQSKKTFQVSYSWPDSMWYLEWRDIPKVTLYQHYDEEIRRYKDPFQKKKKLHSKSRRW